MRFLAPIVLAVNFALHPSVAESQRANPLLTAARNPHERPLTRMRNSSDSVRATRPLVLVGALVGGVAGAVLYARAVHNSDDGDFAAGVAIPLYVAGGVVVGTLVGWVVSVSIENGRTHSGQAQSF